ncbi:MAG: 50S ribosomal protein L17 [Candidatus Omnitrophica bacterium]|nr:50S ribosomal protein L17 [Candidatus Omnitrophota bacterium]
MIKSLLRAVFINERIITTTSRAKYLRAEVDKLITKAKANDLASRRLVYKKLGDHLLVKRIFEVVAPRFKAISGGYTRIAQLAVRKGDGAPLSLLELTKLEPKKKTSKTKQAKAKTAESTAVVSPEKKTEQPKKGLISGVRKIFKKERDTSK